MQLCMLCLLGGDCPQTAQNVGSAECSSTCGGPPDNAFTCGWTLVWGQGRRQCSGSCGTPRCSGSGQRPAPRALKRGRRWFRGPGAAADIPFVATVPVQAAPSSVPAAPAGAALPPCGPRRDEGAQSCPSQPQPQPCTWTNTGPPCAGRTWREPDHTTWGWSSFRRC